MIAAIDAIIVHRICVGRKDALLIPIAQSERTDADHFCRLFYRKINVFHRRKKRKSYIFKNLKTCQAEF